MIINHKEGRVSIDCSATEYFNLSDRFLDEDKRAVIRVTNMLKEIEYISLLIPEEDTEIASKILNILYKNILDTQDRQYELEIEASNFVEEK